MATGVVTWSQTAATNATADATVNWAEGQAPSSINDSARAMMASVAKFRDDTNGSLTTGGTSTAYTLATNQGFASLTALNTHELAFTMSATSGATPTLSVDSLTAKPIRNATGVTLPNGSLLSGSVYRVKYDNSNGEFLIVNQPGVLPTNSVATASVADSAITYAKVQNVSATSRLLGRASSGAGVVEEITLGTGLTLSSTTLNSSAPSLPGAIGLVITNNGGTPNSKIDLTADSIIMLDSSNIAKYDSAVSVTIDTSVSGAANGIDTGSRTSDTWYAIWGISNGSATAGLASLSATSPTMPSGYTYKVRLGWMRTDGSGNFFRSKQRGQNALYNGTTDARTVTTTGTGGSSTNLSLANFVPTTATKARMSLFVNGVGTSNTFAIGSFGPSASSKYEALYTSGSAANVISIGGDYIMDTAQQVSYQAGGGSGSGALDVKCHGWTDKVNAS